MKITALLTAVLAAIVALEARGADKVCSAPDDYWTVTEPQESVVIAPLRDKYRKERLPVTLIGREFDIRRSEGEVESEEDKADNLDFWVTELDTELVLLDFQEASDVDVDQLRDQVVDKMPYAIRDDARRGYGPILAVARTDLRCAGPDSAVGAYIMTALPEPGVGSDYGSIVIAFFGIGRCGPGSSEGRRIAEAALDHLANYVCHELFYAKPRNRSLENSSYPLPKPTTR
jgi:hypothetical protein